MVCVCAPEEAAAAAASGVEYLADYEAVEVGQTIYVTTDMALLKEQWAEVELGPLEDHILKTYLGQPGQVVEIEDDDTVMLRWETYETQWIPVTACSAYPTTCMVCVCAPEEAAAA